MKCFPWLLLILALLSGCAAHSPANLLTEQTVPAAEPAALYDPNSQTEAETRGAIRCYPLQGTVCTGLMQGQDCILLFESAQGGTTISKFDVSAGTITACVTLSFPLDHQDASIHPWHRGFSCFDPISRKTILIDHDLQIAGQIDAPEGMLGIPILSQDGTALYYCTETSIRALEPASGISRVLKESAYSHQSVCALLLDDTVLHCTLNDGKEHTSLFLSAQTGSTQGISHKILDIQSFSARFYAVLQEGNTRPLVFGDAASHPQMLLFPGGSTSYCILPENHAAVTAQQPSPEKITLDHYDLHTGLRTASITFHSNSLPRCFVAQSGCPIWFVRYDSAYDCDTLYCWDPALSPAADSHIYTGIHHTQNTPDSDALEECIHYAQELGNRFGIEILVYRDAASFQPTDYKLVPEHLAPVLMRELRQLEKSLSSFPIAFLQTIVQRFDGLTICIVRSLQALSPSASPDYPNGCQFWNGHHAYIALTAGTDTEQGLYHMLCHLIDTVVLNESSAYDTWGELNPTGFDYDYDYAANRIRNSTAYLLDSSRYFVDMFSMSFPKEDRARIMEYAMTPGSEALFQGPFMQAKLHTLCFGIREAFQMEDSPEVLLWEQYLHTPLAPAS